MNRSGNYVAVTKILAEEKGVDEMEVLSRFSRMHIDEVTYLVAMSLAKRSEKSAKQTARTLMMGLAESKVEMMPMMAKIYVDALREEIAGM